MLKVFKIVIMLVMLTYSVSAQKKNTVRDNNIKSVTEYKQEIDKKGANLKESYTLYDNEGNVLEQIDYDATGKIKSHLKFQYDSNNNKIKEIEISPEGKVMKTTEYKYNGNMKTEKNIYDAAGKLKTKRTYQYVFQK